MISAKAQMSRLQKRLLWSNDCSNGRINVQLPAGSLRQLHICLVREKIVEDGPRLAGTGSLKPSKKSWAPHHSYVWKTASASSCVAGGSGTGVLCVTSRRDTITRPSVRLESWESGPSRLAGKNTKKLISCNGGKRVAEANRLRRLHCANTLEKLLS